MNDPSQPLSEIFRHIRPLWYDHKRHTLTPHERGGVSFLLKPLREGVYNFWICICPEDVEFSSRQAVKTLRDTAERGVVPFGTITPSGEPLVDVLTRYVINERMELPSEASKQLLTITILNGYANKKLNEAQQRRQSSRVKYEER